MGSKKHIPMRTCIVTREKKAKSDLARFVYEPGSKTVSLDETGKLKGRGANLSLSIEVFDQAVKGGAFERAFKTKLDKENLLSLRVLFEKYINKIEFRKGERQVTVRIPGDSIKIG